MVDCHQEVSAAGIDGRLRFVLKTAPGKAELVGDGRGDKILVFLYKRKKQYKKLRGHRQDYTAVRITEIAFDGQSFKAPELPKKEKKVKPAPEGGEEVKTSKRPGKTAKKQVAHAHGKKAAPKRAARKKKKK